MSSRILVASCLLLTLALLLPAPPVAALDLNGFLPAAGQGAVAVSYTSESYDEFWVGETKVSNPGVGEVETETTSVWFTYGFTPNLSIVGNAAYVGADSDGLGGFVDSGLQDFAALLQYRFASISNGAARHDFVVAGGVRAPLSSYEANAPVSLGDGSTDVLLRLVYHLEAGRFYVSQQVGFDRRGDDAPDGMPLLTELGYTVHRVTLSAFYSRYLADGGTDIGDPGFTFPSNQEEYERFGAKVFARVTDTVGVFAQGFTTLDGRNTGDASGVSVGASFSF